MLTFASYFLTLLAMLIFIRRFRQLLPCGLYSNFPVLWLRKDKRRKGSPPPLDKIRKCLFSSCRARLGQSIHCTHLHKLFFLLSQIFTKSLVYAIHRLLFIQSPCMNYHHQFHTSFLCTLNNQVKYFKEQKNHASQSLQLNFSCQN